MTDIATSLITDGEREYLILKNRANTAADDGTYEWALNEIERLREALRHYVSECDCNGGTYHEEDHITGKTLVKDCPKCEAARAALEEDK